MLDFNWKYLLETFRLKGKILLLYLKSAIFNNLFFFLFFMLGTPAHKLTTEYWIRVKPETTAKIRARFYHAGAP